MTTLKNLHVLLNNFVTFCNKEIKRGGEKISLRLFVPSENFATLIDDFEKSNVETNWALNEDGAFECNYEYVNVCLDIEEGATFKLELKDGTQLMEKAMAGGDYTIPGREPNLDYKPKLNL